GAQLLGVAEPEGRGLVDRGGDGLAPLVLALAAVDGARRGTGASPGGRRACLRHVDSRHWALSRSGEDPGWGLRACKRRKSPGFFEPFATRVGARAGAVTRRLAAVARARARRAG